MVATVLAVVIVLGIAAVVLGLVMRRLATPPRPRGERSSGAPAVERAPEPPPDPAAEAARQAAQEQHRREVAALREAIRTRVCPACNAAGFEGSETFKHSLTFRSASGGMGGGSVYELVGSCASCGARRHELDMR